MKITINSTDLSRTLAAVSRCISNKSVLPILECFHIAGVGEELCITGSDNENWLTLPVRPTDITYLDEGDRSFCIESKRFLSILKELPSQPIGLEISADHRFATLRWLNGEASLPIMGAAEYPMPVEVESVGRTFMPAQSLQEVVDTCLFAVANDELRPVMNGIFFDSKDGHLVTCATDSRLLVRLQDTDLQAPASTFILPTKSAQLLGALVANVSRQTDKDETPCIGISVSGNNVEFVGASGTGNKSCGRIVCRMIEGRYPNYNSVIPPNPPYEMTLSRTDLVAAIRRTMVFADPASLLQKWHITADKLTISVDDHNFSTSSEETVPCTFNGPDGFRIGLKASILLDMLAHIDTDEVKVLLTEHTRPVVILPVKTEPTPRALLMLITPMLIDN